MRYLLDTNIISNIVKPSPSENLMAWMADQRDEDLFISSLTVAEIRRGVLEKPAGRRRDQLEPWFFGQEGPQALFAGRVLPFDEGAALIWARLMAGGKARGRPRSALDTIKSGRRLGNPMLRNLFLCAALALAGANAANACWPADRPHGEALATWKGPTIEEQFAKATAVFVARIVRTEEAQIDMGGNTRPVIEATFQTIELLKGRPPEDQKVRSLVFGPGNCAIPILAGWSYVLFLRQDTESVLVQDNAWNFVWWTTGSFPALNLEAKDVKEELAKLRKLAITAQ